MRTRKRARLGFDTNGVFVYSDVNHQAEVPRSVRMVRVNGSIRRIADSAFKGCGGQLEELVMEKGVEEIGRSAFYWCSALTKVNFPSTLTKILDFAFYGCQSLSTMELPLGIQSIGIGAFELCSTLQQLDLSLHTHCTIIDSCAFQGCSQLAVVKLPPNLKGIILMEVFCDCSTLTHIRFPQGVTSISPSAIEGCTSLISLEVPEGLLSLDVVPHITRGSDGIQSCTALVNLYTPPEQWVVRSVDALSFLDDFQLARLAGSWRDLLPKLQNRFENCPLHKLCYFQSYHPLSHTITKMREILQSNPMAFQQVDTFGMTPLHILMLSETPVMELIQELPNAVQTMVHAMDWFRSVPLDYRCKNAAGRDAIRAWLPKLLHTRLPSIGLERWKQEVLRIQQEAELLSDNEETMRVAVGLVLHRLIQVELQESLSLLEKVLWKIQLLKHNRDDAAIDEQSTTYRESCRVHCGISIVVENVLPFLICLEPPMHVVGTSFNWRIWSAQQRHLPSR